MCISDQIDIEKKARTTNIIHKQRFMRDKQSSICYVGHVFMQIETNNINIAFIMLVVVMQWIYVQDEDE